MPGGISNTSLLDLLATTLENLPSLEFETALNYQEYPVCNQWFQGDKVQIDSGTSIKRNIILDTSGNARHVRLYQKTPINVSDVHNQITAPWVQVQTHWGVERREMLRNRKPAKFIDLVQSRRVDGMLDLADLLEQKAWATPSSSTDDLNPYGLPYWISFLGNTGADAAGGFDAYTVRFGDATTSTTKGNINGTPETKWRNYAATYTTINETFTTRLRRAFHACNFKSPMLVKDLKEGPASKFRLYMGLDSLTDYETLVTAANENIGRDLDPFHGMTTFRRVPIVYTPQLDEVTVTDGGSNSFTPDPVYGVNHAKFFPIVQDGDWMRESEPIKDVEQHNVLTTFTDGSYNFFCKNVRAGGFVLHKIIPAS